MQPGSEPNSQDHIPGTCSCNNCTRALQELGSLTGWLLGAPSPQSPDRLPETPEYCPSCGLKLQAQKPGSLTQWIFKYQLCSCQTKERAPASEVTGPDLMPPGDAEIEVSDDFPVERFAPMALTASGATGSIYEAVDRVLAKTVAIKTLRSIDTRQYVDFQNEARAISLLDHPGIVRVLDFSLSEGGTPFMVMEFVKGESLDARTGRCGSPDEEVALDLFVQIGEALAHAHSKGVLHRDLKPENILVEEQPSGALLAKLVDFGLAKITRETLVPTSSGDRLLVGTPAYMSPDTVRGLKYDQRSDIYSFGSVMFEVITGRQPFTGESAMELLARKSSEDPPSLNEAGSSASDEMVRIVRKALARDADQRYQSMNELLADLKRARPLESGTVAESKPQADQESLSGVTVPPRLVFGAGAVVFLGVIIWFGISYSRFDEKAGLREKLSAPVSDISVIDQSTDIVTVGHFYRSQYHDSIVYTSPDPKLKSPHFEDLKDCTDVDGVSVRECPIDLQDMRFLPKDRLKFFSLVKCRISNQALEVIGEMPALLELNMCQVNLRNRPVEVLGNLKRLEIIDLVDTGIESDRLDFLRELPALRKLNFGWNSKVCDARSFALFSHLEPLKILELGGLQPSPADLAQLKNLPHLEILSVGNCHLTDEHLKVVSEISTLKQLVARNNEKLTPRGLEHLLRNKELVEIQLSGCPLISKKDAETAMASRPGLQVDLEHEKLVNDSAKVLKIFSY
ncbi:MAG: protein kinase [Cyanobacteria bacterium HKST-UBA02]|nr:protein kinase [Cyanobacteria bacterium HKST-UBA02]